MRRAFTFASALLVLALAPAVAAAQSREITGRVTRALGDVPVVGATIVEENGRGVAQSGADGSFRITVGPGDVRLLVRAIGFQRKTTIVPATASTVTIARPRARLCKAFRHRAEAGSTRSQRRAAPRATPNGRRVDSCSPTARSA